jgi:hypothetical protein
MNENSAPLPDGLIVMKTPSVTSGIRFEAVSEKGYCTIGKLVVYVVTGLLLAIVASPLAYMIGGIIWYYFGQ